MTVLDVLFSPDTPFLRALSVRACQLGLPFCCPSGEDGLVRDVLAVSDQQTTIPFLVSVAPATLGAGRLPLGFLGEIFCFRAVVESSLPLSLGEAL